LDAAAFGWAAAAKSRSKSRPRLKIGKKRAPKEALPQQGRLVRRAQGSAPRRGKLLKDNSNSIINAPPVRFL